MTLNRIVILGARGYVGSNLLPELEDYEGDIYAPSRSECDLTNQDQLRKVIRKGDIIVNLAAAVLNRTQFIAVNTQGTKNLAQIASEQRAARIIHLSTSHHMAKISPDEYRASKIAAEHFLEEGHVPYLILRPCNIYGKQDRKGIIPKFIIAALQNTEPEKIADTKRDFVYIDDVVDAILTAISSPQTGAFDLAPGRCYGLKEVWEYLNKKSIELEGDLYEVTNLIPPQINFKEGLARTMSYWRQELTRA